jgi:uncharacterized protein (DUF924 family)
MKTNELQLGEVLEFWFGELTKEEWFGGGVALDARIRERFTDMHTAVAAGEYWKYRTSPESFLAEVIVLDQFSRNMFRNTPEAFAYDRMALTLAQQAIMASYDQELPPDQRTFLYLPFMHSESSLIHVEAVRLFESLGSEKHLKFEKIHKDIIDRFGRYPHRNEVLGRASTEEEKTYLANTHESFF